jgi:hypothetical protein
MDEPTDHTPAASNLRLLPPRPGPAPCEGLHVMHCDRCASDSVSIHVAASEMETWADNAWDLIAMAARAKSPKQRRVLLVAAKGQLERIAELAKMGIADCTISSLKGSKKAAV